MAEPTKPVQTAVPPGPGAGPADMAETAAAACRRLLGVEAAPADAPVPGAHGRRQFNSLRMAAGAASLIVSRRSNLPAARREAAALIGLGAQQAPAPRLLAAEGEWLIQEDVGRTLLAQKLHGAGERKGIALLQAAAAALWRCQEAGARAGLAAQGIELAGYDRLLAAPGRVAAALKTAAPAIPAEKILPLIRAPEHVFVKWDARPAKAIVREDGAVFWIGWEDWGRRCRLDDLVWLLCDEWVPHWPRGEDALIAREARAQAAPFGGDAAAAAAYVAAFGALHLLLRLDLILRAKGTGDWWDGQACLALGLIGVTREGALRLVARAARLAAKVEALKPLAAWIESFPEKIAP